MFFCLSSFGKRTAFFLLALFFLFKPAFSQSEVTVVTIISANYSEYKKNENTSEDEIHLSGMETDASVRIGARCPVFQVAFYDTTHIGKLAAYLMVPAGQKLDF